MSEKIKKDWKKIKDDLLQDEQNAAETLADADVKLTDAASLEHLSYSELEEKLTLAEQQAHENWEKSVRALAELDNVRRRAKLDVENAHRYGLEKIINSLLPVVDSMEQALQAAGQHDTSGMREGLELTMKLFIDVLQKHNVQQFDPQGEAFNPQDHDAMTIQESADVPPNTILAVFQKGYKLNDRVIRPARVIVSKSKA